MASKADPETYNGAVPPPPSGGCKCSMWFMVLRVLLFASTLTAVILMVASKQTKQVPVPGVPVPVPVEAKYSHSPAFIYFIAALSIVGFYSIITMFVSILLIKKPLCSPRCLLHLVLWDVVMFGLTMSATGTAGAVAYIGLKGNKHVGWNKVCNVYDKFCQYLGASIAVSLFASFVLLILIIMSVCSLKKNIPK